MLRNSSFKVEIYGQKSMIHSPNKEIFQKLYNEIYFQKEIPENDANLLVVYGRYFDQLDIERCNVVLKIFEEIADILVDPNRDQISNFNEFLKFDSEILQKKLKFARFVFVQKEGEEFLDKFRYFCSEITRNNQDGETFHKHVSSEILEKARDLANFFLNENVVFLDSAQHESLQLLEAKFKNYMIVQCTKSHSALPGFFDYD